jgi:hypothetical protein
VWRQTGGDREQDHGQQQTEKVPRHFDDPGEKKFAFLFFKD